MMVNAFGAVTTAIVATIVRDEVPGGAWISMLAMGCLAIFFWTISRHYHSVEERLRLPEGGAALANGPTPNGRTARTMIVPVDEVNLAVIKAIRYSRSMSSSVIALHITDDIEEGEHLRESWESTLPDVPLVLINSPYRSFVVPFISYLDALSSSDPSGSVTVVLPEYRTAFPWQGWLHNQSARRLRHVLLDRPNTVVVQVPYRDLGPARGDEQQEAGRSRAPESGRRK